MAVKLHRCTVTWRVQKALADAGIPFEVVKHPAFPRGRRDDLEAKTGQRALPALEFEDGTTLREESSDLVARIASGQIAPATAPR